MNRIELIELMADKAQITKASAERALSAFLEGVSSSLQKGETVVLINFGTFIVKAVPERQGRNPKTGEKMTIKATKRVSFKVGKALKDAANKQ